MQRDSFRADPMAVPKKTKPRKKTYHHGDLARALVSAAVEIIERHGPEAITLREVASSVGVTHGAAYRHFEDKTALLAAVAEEGYRKLTERLRAASAERDPRGPRARLESLAATYVAFAMDHPAHYRVMSGPRLNEEGRFPSLEEAIHDAFHFLTEEIARGQAEGVFRHGVPRDLAVAFWVAGHGFADLVLHRRLRVKSPAAAVEYFNLLVAPLYDGLLRKP
jgi:AcrR family transcriptional regulator